MQNQTTIKVLKNLIKMTKSITTLEEKKSFLISQGWIKLVPRADIWHNPRSLPINTHDIYRPEFAYEFEKSRIFDRLNKIKILAKSNTN